MEIPPLGPALCESIVPQGNLEQEVGRKVKLRLAHAFEELCVRPRINPEVSRSFTHAEGREDTSDHIIGGNFADELAKGIERGPEA